VSVYLIIFGAAVHADGSPSGSLARRVEGAIAFARTVAKPKFIATGGIGRYGPAEAVVIRELLMRSGIGQQDILLEDQARDTLDSIEFCHAILVGCDDVEVVVPCTSTYHIPRCALLFRMLGYAIRIPPMPSDQPHLPWPKRLIYVIKECVAVPYDALLLSVRHWMMRRTVRQRP
jgi:uncharacterized SAM-binding protein YcdF (DUF218 family)